MQTVSWRRCGNGAREAVGAAELLSSSASAAASTASAIEKRGGGNVDVASTSGRASFAATPTLLMTVDADGPIRGEEVGVPESALASCFA